jgi:hypothetical protein
VQVTGPLDRWRFFRGENKWRRREIESVNQRRLWRPNRPQSHATPQKNEGKARLAEPGSRPASLCGSEAVPNRATAWRRPLDSKVPPGQI